MNKWTEGEIKGLLLTRTDAVCKALVRLVSFQTADERLVGQTVHHNGAGFNGYDAKLLTSFAEQVEKGRGLSEKQLTIARKRLVKYTRQLADYANTYNPKKG